MAVYINGIGNISPQKSWGESTLLQKPLSYTGDKLSCLEPDYAQFIDARYIRRMSRVIKMGVASAIMAMKEAEISLPDGIITGTGYGCLEDTGIFLTKMITNNEEALNPTPFIQSTHNTIGSQIALLLQCQSYNQTYSQSGLSFENALLDALLQLSGSPRQSLLVGGIDEITPLSHSVQNRFGIFRKNSLGSLDFLKTSGQGTLNGEGSAFFVLSAQKNEKTKVCIEAVTTFYKPDTGRLHKSVGDFLRDHSIDKNETDLVLWGKSGGRHDQVLNDLDETFFPESSAATFKNLCGEYPVASAFAVGLATEIMKYDHVPECISIRNRGRSVKNVLIFNQYFGSYYSLIYLRAC
jgi:3-oxoacyl-[acyl-carrier-protein] synthase II